MIIKNKKTEKSKIIEKKWFFLFNKMMNAIRVI